MICPHLATASTNSPAAADWQTGVEPTRPKEVHLTQLAAAPQQPADRAGLAQAGSKRSASSLNRKGCKSCSCTSRQAAHRPADAGKRDPNAGAALQELLGSKYGEMSTLNNYMYQSFNFRSKSKLRAIYDIVASITAEEVGHVELVANGVAMLNNGPDAR